MGNVVPTLFAMPFLVGGCAVALIKGDAAAIGGGIVAIGLLVGLFSLNRFGLFENAAMRTELRSKLGRSVGGMFVGFATPTYRSSLDPHEDIGFLDVREDELVFIGESRTVQLPRSSITRITRRSNPHSWVGLGGWVSVEGTLEGRPVRMLIEPRQAETLLGNKRIARTLRIELDAWRRGAGTKRADSSASL